MKKLWQLKEEARQLRKQGLLYKKIAEKVPIHRTTLSKWCKDIELTPEQIKSHGKRYASRLKGAKANYIKRQKEIQKIRKEAEEKIRPLIDYEFKIAGIALYWGEGDKKDLTISNSDPNLIKFIMGWFRKTCLVPEEKFKTSLYLHTGQNEKNMKKYWAKTTKIPLAQFNKTIFKTEGSATRKYDGKQYKGTIKIRVADTSLKHKIFAWVEQLQFYLGA